MHAFSGPDCVSFGSFQVLYCLMTVVAVTLFTLNFFSSANPLKNEAFYVEALQVSVFPVAGLLTRSNHTRTRRASTLLLVSLPLYLVAQALSLRTFHLIGGNHADLRLILTWVLTATVALAFVLELKGPERAEDLEDRESPYVVANFYSRFVANLLRYVKS